MNLHEYQSKRLFSDYGIPVPPGKPAKTGTEAVSVARELGGDGWVIKAQVHAGGRGKAGGVKLVKSLVEVTVESEKLLGKRLVTLQTGEAGLPINTVYVEATREIVQELYMSMLVDRQTRKVLLMVSSAGGMDIEEVAVHQPEKIRTVAIHPVAGLQPFQLRQVVFDLGLDTAILKQLIQLSRNLYRLFLEKDCSLIEINPLGVTAEGNLIALDSKVGIDDNALFRQPDIAAMRDISQENEVEYEAQQHGLNYIPLDGNIACMVNGAGLAMATMDLIKLHGGEPANFLDVGGGTNEDKVAEAFKIILADKKVKAVLVNIFGGIVRCDLIAEGIVKAAKEVGIDIPVVVRLEGTNVDRGKEVLNNSGLSIISVDSLTQAAETVVAQAGEA